MGEAGCWRPSPTSQAATCAVSRSTFPCTSAALLPPPPPVSLKSTPNFTVLARTVSLSTLLDTQTTGAPDLAAVCVCCGVWIPAPTCPWLLVLSMRFAWLLLLSLVFWFSYCEEELLCVIGISLLVC